MRAVASLICERRDPVALKKPDLVIFAFKGKILVFQPFHCWESLVQHLLLRF
jgi:hypothetical protein